MSDAATVTAPEDYSALVAERDELRARLAAVERRAPSRHRIRRVSAVVLVVLACLSFLVAMPGLWASRNLLDTDRFVSRVGPLVDEPRVQELLATRLTEQVMLLVEPRQLFEQVLPERGQILAAPLANAVQGFVRHRVEQVVASDAFGQLWVRATTLAHRTAIRVLRGESEAVTTADGQVTLNLVPAVDAVLARITSASPEIFGRRIDLPDASVEDVPQAAIERVERAFDVELDDDFGQFTIYDDGQLEAAQRALDTFGRIVAVVLPLAIVLAALALWVSTGRRRTLLQLAVGAALAALLVRRAAFTLDDEVVALAPTEQGRSAMVVVLDAFLTPLMTFAAWTIGVAAVVAAVALVTGPHRWAVAGRARTASVWRSVVSSAAERSGDMATQRWVRAHRDPLTIGGALVAVLVLWVAELSWFGVLVLLVVVGAFVVGVHRIAAAPEGEEVSAPADPGSVDLTSGGATVGDAREEAPHASHPTRVTPAGAGEGDSAVRGQG